MSKRRGYGQYGCPTFNQSAKIIAKFGGEPRMAGLLGVSRITLYRWGYARPLGTDGLIPNAMVPKIQEIARLDGVLLTVQDWEPEKISYEETR